MQLLSISFVSFFHFLLDHGISAVETWVYHHGWQIIILCKGLSLFITGQILINGKDRQSLINKKIWNGFNWPTKKYTILSFGFIVTTLLLSGGNQQFQFEIEAWKILNSAVGGIFLHGCDILFLFLLGSIFEIGRRPKFMLSVFFPMLISIANIYTYNYGRGDYFILVVHLFCLSFILVPEKVNLIDILLYLLVVVVPLTTIWGADPIWGSDFSILKVDRYPTKFEYGAIVGILFLYSFARDKISKKILVS